MRDNFDKIIDEVEAKGYRQGIELGIEQGIEKGIEEGKEISKEQMVKAMIAEGLDISIIARVTGLKPEEIIKRKETLQ
ncbi:hypothetical protein [Paenibacillus hamazuiensis]|uniref:hypothetical protein n=1 Tax=Paenibacillus hamazuiensis TaxID=2936508 RepID=UPI002010121C|nr:hypothetical protein [Paenibacillus hamazuiensis]